MTDNIFTALFKFQGLVRGVKRDSKNPHFKNNYASLEAVTDTIRPHMQECGLMWLQSPGKIVDNAIEVKTIIAYAETKETIEFTMEMPMAKRDPQGAGSALTYAMRYSLMAALGLPPTDDDAETAIDRENARPEPDKAPVKSSAALKRAKSWEELSNELEQDMVDVRSLVNLEQVKAHYRHRAKSEGWTAAWLSALKNEFDTYEERLMERIALEQVEDDIADAFPGARVVNETLKHPLAAG
jgi:hypothetical protein